MIRKKRGRLAAQEKRRRFQDIDVIKTLFINISAIKIDLF